MRRWLVAALAALTVVPVAHAKSVRVFAVGPRFDLSWVDTKAHFEGKLDGMLAPLHRTGRDLVVMPEDLGLMAAFSGDRGAAARGVTTDTGGLIGAIATLLGSYSAQNAYYTSKYPALANRGIPTRALALGLTDTFGHVAVESYAALAAKYHVWLAAGVNMARSWRIVCTDKATFVPPPGATKCDEQNPELVSTLGEAGRDYAYEATTPDPVNMALLFNPSGTLVAKAVKAYLTPTELPGQLDLVPGDPHALRAIKTPLGKLGFVTSKDAWMPDITGRLDDAGVQLLVQPEFFVNDTVKTTGMWAPDNLKAAGYSDLLRHPAFQAMALPSMTGDLYDFSADAQSHIAVRGGKAGALIGQDPAPGLVAVQPWLAKDPFSESLASRRETLGKAGEAAVGTGTQQEGVIQADIDLRGTPKRRAVKRRRDLPLAPSTRDQRNVALASAGRRVYAAWEEGGKILSAASADAGHHWSKPRVRGRGRHPALAARHGTVWLAFERADGKVVAAEGPGKPQTLAPKGGPHQERPAIAVLHGDDAYAVWLDDRTGNVGVYGAPVGDVAKRIDTDGPTELAAQMDNAWAPSVAIESGKLFVAWADFRGYQWDVYSRTSSNLGGTFAPAVKVNDGKGEALDDSPRAAFLKNDPYVVWTDFRHRESPAPSPLYDVDGAPPAFANKQLDADGQKPVDAFAPAVAQLPGGGVAVAWQSNRGATADVMARTVGARRVRRVDDAGNRRVNSWRPAITALPHGRVLVAWEDDRDGPANVFGRVLVLPSAKSP